MTMVQRALVIALAALTSAPSRALDVNDRTRFQIVAGDPSSGEAKVFDTEQEIYIEGLWRGGRTQGGQAYTISHPRGRGSVFTLTFDEEGLPSQGVLICARRASGSKLPHFEGTFKKQDHTFSRERIAVPEQGVYRNGLGLEYRGSFEFIPAKSERFEQTPVGYLVFHGEIVDLEEESTETRLCVSERFAFGDVVKFVRAEPEYLTTLQERYQRDAAIAQEKLRRQEARSRWVELLTFAAEIALMTQGGSLPGDSGQNRLVLNLVKSIVTSQQAGQPISFKGLVVETLVSAGLNEAAGGKGAQLSQAVMLCLDNIAKPAMTDNSLPADAP